MGDVTVRDQNGRRLTRSVKRERDGSWSATVWFGGCNGLGTDARRLRFKTRASARQADISNYPQDPNWIGYMPIFDY